MPLAVVNELSLEGTETVPSAEEVLLRLSRLAAALAAARSLRSDLALVSPAGIGGAVWTREHKTLSEVARLDRSGRAVTEWQYVQALLSRAPWHGADAGIEWSVEGVSAVGLGLAGNGGHLAVSFFVDGWDRSSVTVVEQSLENENGETVLRERTIDVHHAAREGHVDEHREFVRGLALPPEGPDAGDLWEDRASLYPALRFLPKVEAELREVERQEPVALAQIHRQLRALSDATEAWEDGKASPDWRTKVTSESARRRELCRFGDGDGVVRSFDLHSRYTPGPGRIHFRIGASADERWVTIGYIGRKLGA